MFARSRGSQTLAGAAPMGYRVPAHTACLHTLDIAQWVEHQIIKSDRRGFESRYPTSQPLETAPVTW